MKTISREEVFEVLGLEPQSIINKAWLRDLVREFRLLAQDHDENTIWLRGDYGIYCKGKILATTENLIVVRG